MALPQTISISANGNSTSYAFEGGTGNITAWGTWSGATVKLQHSVDGTNFVDSGTDAQFTDDGSATFELPSCLVRVNTASGSTPSLTVKLSEVPQLEAR